MSFRKTVDKSFARRVAALNKKAMCQEKVVNLSDFRSLYKSVESKTILIVDDEQVMRNAIKRIFEKEQYHVVAAKDAMELSRILEDTRLDLILLDINLPWVNGYELCQLIKSHPTLKNLPVAFISGNKTEEDVRKGFDVGADEYITKPFEVDEIQKIVSKLLLKDSA